MIVHKFVMGFDTYSVMVSKLSDGEIRCWKTNNVMFDYEMFHNHDDAIEYITTPMPTLEWRVDIDE